MYVTPDNHLEFLRRHIITRTDVYARQQKDGRYHKVAKELTDAALNRHLEHKITLGCYNTLDNHVKYALLDVDGHEGAETVPDEIVRGRARKLILTLNELGVPHTFAESSPGSYHIAVLFDPPATTEKAYDFIRWVARNAELPDTEVFPKQREVTEDGYGNLVRLPWSLHQKKQVPYRYINESFEHIDEFDVQTIDISGYTFQKPETQQVKEWDTSCTNIDDTHGLRSTGSLGGVPPCIEGVLRDNVQMISTGGHYFRLAVVSAYRGAGLDHAQICRLFTKQDDYNPVITDQQVHSVLKRSDGYSYSCRTMQDKCGNLVKKYCKSCPRSCTQ